KRRQPRRLNDQRLPGARITAGARRPTTSLEGSESRQTDVPALDQRTRDQTDLLSFDTKQTIDYSLRLPKRQPGAARERARQFALVHPDFLLQSPTGARTGGSTDESLALRGRVSTHFSPAVAPGNTGAGSLDAAQASDPVAPLHVDLLLV